MSRKMVIQQVAYYIICIIRIILNSLVQIYQTNATIPQQVSFTGNLEENYGATMFSIAKKQQKAILNILLETKQNKIKKMKHHNVLNPLLSIVNL